MYLSDLTPCENRVLSILQSSHGPLTLSALQELTKTNRKQLVLVSVLYLSRAGRLIETSDANGDFLYAYAPAKAPRVVKGRR